MEQALLNLLKNAHESGSPADDVQLSVRRLPGVLRIEVLDRGTGMNEAVLTNALVPFYSTKRSGTGLGLALAREIAEAHGGRIALDNRDGGGLWSLGVADLGAGASRGWRPCYGDFFGRFQPGMLCWRPRATVNSPSGALRVITDPAPIVASLPMFTGATSDELEPMKAPSCIRVSDLLTPS